MESLGIIELLGWYLVGFSATIGLLELLSKLNILKGKVKKRCISNLHTISVHKDRGLSLF
jgi:hypothetical protein